MQTHVVGVDLSPASADALRWAVGNAAAHDARLVVVHAFDFLRQVASDGTPTFDPEYSREDAAQRVQSVVDGAIRAIGADVPVDTRIVVVKPAEALLEAADELGADLVVVGSRGTGGFRGLLMGSVSQQVAMHAPCSVVVHRPTSS